jgi:prepilin-type N-terminal cleavage/methylation domain-containing protein
MNTCFPLACLSRKTKISLTWKSSQHSVYAFTLVELLVSTVIIGIILGGLIAFPQIIGRGSRQSQLQNASQSAIDSDLATMRLLANNFSCCSGRCTTSLSPSPCNGKTPGQEGFYIPEESSAAETTFNAACNSGTLATNLETTLSSQNLNAAINSRTVVEDSALAHRLRVTYTAPGNVERIALLVPTAAAFCPDPVS